MNRQSRAYTVTSHQAYLLVADSGKGIVIPKPMQTAAERTVLIRKNLKGASWKNRYHGRDEEGGDRLARCIAHSDTPRVRTEAVSRPSMGPFSGWNEIQTEVGFSEMGRDILQAGEEYTISGRNLIPILPFSRTKRAI